jgi:hypothetical protein
VRKPFWAVIVCGLSLTASASAQQFGGISPKDIQFVPVDTSKGLAAPVLPVPQSNPGFSLTSFFSKLNPINLFRSPSFGTSNLPSPGSFPSTHYKSPLYALPPRNP